MKSIIVGTAGHIDHGKTALVKALTGIDADRLEEEKRRGITIDLGFAHMDMPAPNGEKLRLGFVDVPGHERFVRNMLAGIAGIDLVLLVIAADEAIKPQTREHFDILQLLGVRRGITVLTKSDAVDSETLDVVRLEVEEFLRGTFLDNPNSIIAVSSLTGAGLDELKRAMIAAAAEAQARDSHALTRLPIDRVFTMKGFGTVVTGTLMTGTIRREDELEVFPTDRRVRVRGLQVHGQTTDIAVAGQRTAVNLAGTSTEDLSRGMTLAPPGAFETTRRADVKLRLLPSVPRPLKDRSRVHFHSYTMETIAEIALRETKQKQIAPGEEVFARLKLPEAALLLPGDRFIIRQFSPVVTIGGGVVLDATPMRRMPEHATFLNILAGGDTQAILKARIARRMHEGITTQRLVAETGWLRSVIETQLAQALRQRQVLRIGDRLVHAPAILGLQQLILKKLDDFHKKNPLVSGIAKEELREQAGASAEVFGATLEILVHEKKIGVSGDLVRVYGQGVVMKDEEAESKKTIEDAFASAGLQVPALQQVIAGLKVDRIRAQKIVTLLLRDKVLIKISDELVFHRSALEALRRQMAAYKLQSSKIDVAKFKELTGITRKYAIPLLEYLDRERVTKRVGDAREIL
ncbi:MAG TPA: selenocysteine-specific translation elongation factor [Candidatus Dormibacteraeota bacterium]|jgi:selenocysteine-specific elongation factor|nr:selenocysteine-specific translation elongation factor [Candidatus Dormibacteraeota bacterium]